MITILPLRSLPLVKGYWLMNQCQGPMLNCEYPRAPLGYHRPYPLLGEGVDRLSSAGLPTGPISEQKKNNM